MKIFENSKSFADFTEKDFEFTKLVNQISDLSNEFFYTYKDEYGIPSNELLDFFYYGGMKSEILEDEETDLIKAIYIPNMPSVNRLKSFLENYDLISVNSDGSINIADCNSEDMGRIIMSMVALCK